MAKKWKRVGRKEIEQAQQRKETRNRTHDLKGKARKMQSSKLQ